MAVPRKTFRIEETAATRLGLGSDDAATDDTQADLRHAEIMRELAAIRVLLADMAQPRKSDAQTDAAAGRLASELSLIRGAISGDDNTAKSSDAPNAPITRMAHELNAVVNGTERATHTILTATEEIEQIANNLSAALAGKLEQGLAQDIQDLAVRIFESCNFQDLTGQRVNKVMDTLKFVEEHITRVLAAMKNASPHPELLHDVTHLHGPRLDSDRGHASQGDVDAMFGAG
jgi:chemotaxis protein CheZ